MADERWEVLDTFEDPAVAEVIAALVRDAGVPASVNVVSPLPGLVNAVTVTVPRSLAHRARWVVNSAKVTDAELNYAATGKLGDDED